MARFFLKEHKKNLNKIIKKGESQPLNKIGTHCKGAIFKNAENHITPELTEYIDKISQALPSFY